MTHIQGMNVDVLDHLEHGYSPSPASGLAANNASASARSIAVTPHPSPVQLGAASGGRSNRTQNLCRCSRRGDIRSAAHAWLGTTRTLHTGKPVIGTGTEEYR